MARGPLRPLIAGYTVMCRRSWEPCFPLSRLLVRLASRQICMDEWPGAKLKKPRPDSPASTMTSVSSRTFSLAQQQHTSPSRHRPGQLIEAHSGPLQTRNVPSPIISNAQLHQLSAMRQNPQQQSPQSQPQPQTAAEQYWAARALKAETLLHAQEIHQKSLKSTLMEQELKRQEELKALTEQHKDKHAYLERLLAILMAFIAILVGVVIYLAAHFTNHSLSMQKAQRPWWSAIAASHFTIPILSPFTSVVEHETSVIGTRIIATGMAIFACLAYAVFRYWITAPSRPPARPTPSSESFSRSLIDNGARFIDR